jgi:hypothetical protein
LFFGDQRLYFLEVGADVFPHELELIVSALKLVLLAADSVGESLVPEFKGGLPPQPLLFNELINTCEHVFLAGELLLVAVEEVVLDTSQ